MVVFILEFGKYYSSKIRVGTEEPIKAEHGCVFFDKNDWNAEEWNKFYSYMMDCSCQYHCNGLQIYNHRNVGVNSLRQVAGEEFTTWITARDFQLGMTYLSAEEYSKFLEVSACTSEDVKPRDFTSYLRAYADSKGLLVDFRRSNSVAKFEFRR